MDYETKPISRESIRILARFFRKLFKVDKDGPFPVLEVLDHICEVFPGSGYIIVEDNTLPAKTMAQCTTNNSGGYTIEIKESVYDGAYRNKTGAFRGFICHEICHIFLFSVGYTPIMARTFDKGAMPAYRSVEWQAKALCGEVMIPFDKSEGMSETEIVTTYQVSKAFAQVRRKQKK